VRSSPLSLPGRARVARTADGKSLIDTSKLAPTRPRAIESFPQTLQSIAMFCADFHELSFRSRTSRLYEKVSGGNSLSQGIRAIRAFKAISLCSIEAPVQGRLLAGARLEAADAQQAH